MWLAIEGLIGAGKTTTTELLAGSTDLSAVIERSEDHPFLKAYYADPRHAAIETELAFMLIQRHQLRDRALKLDRVSDFSPGKNLIFARMVCSKDELQLLQDFEAKLWAGIPGPDLTVFIEVPASVCLERIAQRGRVYEQGLSVSDLERLATAYADALPDLGRRVETIQLDGTESEGAVAELVAAVAGLRPR
jgi:deoxyguanosine kinase